MRGGVVESVHRVSAALADVSGRLVAWVGDPGRVTFLRSSAKPFQALPLVEDGAADAFAMTDLELAICCGSHNGEPGHVKVVADLLERVGCSEADLACGPHAPLHGPSAEDLFRRGARPTRLHNNCSGKHAGMLAWSRHAGVATRDYHRPHHPVQVRTRREISTWLGMDSDTLPTAVDGCGVPTFAAPLERVAWAYARLVQVAVRERESPAGRVASAMASQPYYVAGAGRLSTELMVRGAGRILAKGGAEGVLCAGLLESGEGLALKVEDGHRRAVGPAALEFLRRVGRLDPDALESLAHHHRVPVKNTRGELVGELRAELHVSFS